mgnify:CR=1 FL=1
MSKYTVAPAPHVHGGDSVQKNMLNVILALMPAFLAGIYYFGTGAIVVSGIAILSCVAFEWLITKFLLKKEVQIFDCSAILTGMLLGMNLPSSLPWWMVVIGSLIAIGIGKMSFGGLGNNLFNPALVGRVFLLISFPAAMTTWPIPAPFTFDGSVDALTAATPLAYIKEGIFTNFTELDLFLGNNGGSLGETSGVALLLGLIYLLATRTITWHIPVSIIATVLVFTGIMHAVDPEVYASPLLHITSGGLLLGSIFMATDYVTSPMTKTGQLIFGFGIGVITVVIRLFGSYPEGISFAILIMNAVVPLINRYIRPKRFGAK